MIFRNGMQQPSDGKIFSFLDYVPVRYNIDDGGTSRRILDYKNKAEYMLRDYAKHLNGILGEDFAIAVMPSSSVENNYNSASHDTAGRSFQPGCPSAAPDPGGDPQDPTPDRYHNDFCYP